MANPRSMTNYKQWLNTWEAEAQATLRAMFPNGKMDMNDPANFEHDTKGACESVVDFQAALRVLKQFEMEVPVAVRPRKTRL